MRRLGIVAAAAVCTTLALLLSGTTPAAGGATPTGYAPLNRPGPRLSVSTHAFKSALLCHGPYRANRLEPVLLIPATGVTPKQNYSWNYERAFTAQRRPWCTITMPHHTLGDIQIVGEYIVRGIRTLHRRTARQIAVMGHSQGGMSMRWALRFWPDARPLVGDVIGMAGSNHGTTALPVCRAEITRCTPAVWQQQADAAFIKALNSRAETFRSISYTEIYSHTDEVVLPANDPHPSSAVRGGANVTNVATQSICPGDVYEHLLMGTVDPVTYALVIDALDHRGPARPARIDRAVCRQLYQPGVDPSQAAAYIQMLEAAPGLASVPLPFANLVGAPETSHEPKLRCYVFAGGC